MYFSLKVVSACFAALAVVKLTEGPVRVADQPNLTRNRYLTLSKGSSLGRSIAPAVAATLHEQRGRLLDVLRGRNFGC